jgi:hypothetical protein
MLCHYAECGVLFIFVLNVVMLSVIVLSVVAPLDHFSTTSSFDGLATNWPLIQKMTKSHRHLGRDNRVEMFSLRRT